MKKLFISLLLIVLLINIGTVKTFSYYADEPSDVNYVSEVNEIFNTYYNNGVYVKDTSINLTNDAKEDLITYFHANTNILQRTTYYKNNELWMSSINNKYSYYGTNESGLTYAVTTTPTITPESVDVVVKDTTMLEYYTTLEKIKENNAFWSKDEDIYYTTDKTVLKYYLDFTAPCLLESIFTSNYFDYEKATVEVIGNNLVMRLYINNEMNNALTNEECILSEAVISISNYLFSGKISSNNHSYNELPDSLEGVDINDLSALKAAFDSIGDNYLSKTKVYFNELALKRVDKIYNTNFYCNQTTIYDENYIYKYSNDFFIDSGYVNYNNSIYHASLEGVDLYSKLNSTINNDSMELLHDNKNIKDCYFTVGNMNSEYVDKYGPTTVKYTSTYTKEYLGWTRISANKYKCDREEVLLDFLSLCAPGFSNEGTYMTFRYVTVELNPDNETQMRLRLYASPTQSGKMIASHKDLENKPNWYLLFAECYISMVDQVNVNAFENLYK